MLNNCAGGSTPWGTWLTCEENFSGYFWRRSREDADAKTYQRYSISKATWYGWSKYFDRFNVEGPNEPNRFGWVVEIDPYDPTATPRSSARRSGRFARGLHLCVGQDGGSSSTRATTSASTTSTVRHRQAVEPAGSRGQPRSLLDEGTLCTSPALPTTARSSGCCWCTARGPRLRERLRQPGRRGHLRAKVAADLQRRRRWTDRRMSRQIRSMAGSMSC